MSSKPSITYGHAFLDDCGVDLMSLYAKTEDGQTLQALETIDDDYYKLGVTGSIGNKIGFWSYPDEGGSDELALSSTAYPFIIIRYKTNSSSIKAKVELVFHAGGSGSQVVLAETSSLTWKTVVVAITPSETIDHLRLYANGATGIVYYEFILICKGQFQIPNTANGFDFDPAPRYAEYIVPGAVGNERDCMGAEPAIVTMNCDLDIDTGSIGDVGNWLRTGDLMKGQVFVDISHNAKSEPFQWIDLGDLVAQFKVTLDKPGFSRRTNRSEANHTLDLIFSEYRRGRANDETYIERFGLDL